MAERLSGAVAAQISGAIVALVLMALSSIASAQRFPPGYVDPEPLLAAAAAEIGEANLSCIRYSGEGSDVCSSTCSDHANFNCWTEAQAALTERSRTIAGFAGVV